MLEIKKILFPVDFTQNSSKLLRYVLSISDKYDSMIYLLHIIEDLSQWGSGFYVPHLPLKQYQNEALKGAENRMDKICDEQLKSCPNFQRMIVSGTPAVEILKTVESETIDLVIIGTHGRKGLEHTIFGSVAENVVKKSSAPVLIINPYKLKET